jgi:hypothetical protein
MVALLIVEDEVVTLPAGSGPEKDLHFTPSLAATLAWPRKPDNQKPRREEEVTRVRAGG